MLPNTPTRINKYSGRIIDGEAASAEPDVNVAIKANSEGIIVDAPKKKRVNGIFLGLLLFVMIPLPGTGAWTGALIASLFELPKKRSFLAIFLGVLGAGVIMTLASYGVVGFLKVFI